MKIEKVGCIPMVYLLEEPIYSDVGKCSQRQLLLVRIYTDNGLVGLGEVVAYGGPVQSTLAVLERETAPILIGENPRDVKCIWHKYSFACFQYGRSGVLISALSGVDIALRDLFGKSALTPLYWLPGGFKRSAPMYGSDGLYMENKGTGELVQEAEHYADMGMRGVRIKVARTDIPSSLGVFNRPDKCGMVTTEEDIEWVAAVKKTLENDYQLMLDTNATWSYPDALAAGKEYDRLGIHLLEEPVRTDDYEGSVRLTADLVTRITGYETECPAANYMRMIRMGAMDMVQPDLSWCSGITQTRKIAATAEVNFMECITHVWSSGILLAASVHFTRATPNGATVEYDLSDNILRGGLSRGPLRPDSSRVIILSDAPGLGIELREEIIEKYRIRLFWFSQYSLASSIRSRAALLRYISLRQEMVRSQQG